MAVKGVDISGPISPCTAADLKAAGVGFVICKTGFGSDYPGQQDSGFAANIKRWTPPGSLGSLSLFLRHHPQRGHPGGQAHAAAAEREKASLRRVV